MRLCMVFSFLKLQSYLSKKKEKSLINVNDVFFRCKRSGGHKGHNRQQRHLAAAFCRMPGNVLPCSSGLRQHHQRMAWVLTQHGAYLAGFRPGRGHYGAGESAQICKLTCEPPPGAIAIWWLINIRKIYKYFTATFAKCANWVGCKNFIGIKKRPIFFWF